MEPGHRAVRQHVRRHRRPEREGGARHGVRLQSRVGRVAANGLEAEQAQVRRRRVLRTAKCSAKMLIVNQKFVVSYVSFVKYEA